MAKFDTYREAFPNARLSRKANGVLEVALHTDGGKLVFNRQAASAYQPGVEPRLDAVRTLRASSARRRYGGWIQGQIMAADSTNTLRIVGLGGSLRPGSSSRAALRVSLDGAADAGATVALLDLRLLQLPIYDPNSDYVPESVTQFVESVYAADGMIWSSPLYHGSVSGTFKNALDWLILLNGREPPLLTDRVIGLISVAGGTRGLQAVNAMEFIVRALRAFAVPLVVPIPQSWKAFEDTGRPANPQIEEPLHLLGGEVVRVSRRIAQKEEPDPAAACAAAAARLAKVAPDSGPDGPLQRYREGRGEGRGANLK